MTIYMVIIGEYYYDGLNRAIDNRTIRSAYTNEDAAKKAVACWRELYKDRKLSTDGEFTWFKDNSIEHYCFILKVDAKHLFEGEEDLYLIQG